MFAGQFVSSRSDMDRLIALNYERNTYVGGFSLFYSDFYKFFALYTGKRFYMKQQMDYGPFLELSGGVNTDFESRDYEFANLLVGVKYKFKYFFVSFTFGYSAGIANSKFRMLPTGGGEFGLILGSH